MAPDLDIRVQTSTTVVLLGATHTVGIEQPEMFSAEQQRATQWSSGCPETQTRLLVRNAFQPTPRHRGDSKPEANPQTGRNEAGSRGRVTTDLRTQPEEGEVTDVVTCKVIGPRVNNLDIITQVVVVGY
jgi:hypothetical protein